MSESMYMFYEKWVETEEYRQQSAIENDVCRDFEKKVEKVMGKELFENVEDDIIGLAEKAEQSGFSNGFRFGVLFMNEMLKGGVMV